MISACHKLYNCTVPAILTLFIKIYTAERGRKREKFRLGVTKSLPKNAVVLHAPHV